MAPPTAVSTPGRVMQARRGTLQRTLRLSGTLNAERGAVLIAPKLRGSRSYSSNSRSTFNLTLEKLVPAGSRVQKGDVVAVFDRQYMLTRLDDHRADVEQRRLITQRIEAGLLIRRKALDQRFLVAQANVEKGRLNMRTVEVRSAIQAERFRLALEEAEAQKKLLEVEARYFDDSEHAELRREELRLRREQLELGRAEQNVESMTYRAPLDGVVVPARVRKEKEIEYSEIQAGDEVRSGYPFLSVVDTDSLALIAELNQVDAAEISVGMKATVQLDSAPGLEIPGHVESVGSIATANRYRPEWVSRITAKISLDGIDSRAFPNSTGSADLVLGEAAGVIVPRECVSEGSARVWTGEAAERRAVEVGLESATESLIVAGLDGSERLLCGSSPPTIP